jgi:hypothetical protein
MLSLLKAIYFATHGKPPFMKLTRKFSAILGVGVAITDNVECVECVESESGANTKQTYTLQDGTSSCYSRTITASDQKLTSVKDEAGGGD